MWVGADDKPVRKAGLQVGQESGEIRSLSDIQKGPPSFQKGTSIRLWVQKPTNAHRCGRGPSVWTGRALQAENDDLEKVGLALLYPAY
jgi:hypothetical protein